LAIAQQDLIRSPSNEQDFDGQSNRNSSQQTKEEHLGPYSFGKVEFTAVTIENLSDLEDSLAPLGYSVQDGAEFVSQYNQNCMELFKAIKGLRFNDLEAIWSSFWQSSSKDNSMGDR
jgi:hypothetical protein